MSTPAARLAFFKLNVPDMDKALAFYGAVFGLAVTATFDEDEFLEHILGTPGQQDGLNLILVQYKDGREVAVGPGHGPVGFMTDDIDALFARAIGAGANPIVPVFDLGPVKVGIFLDPDGHEIELVQQNAA
ncbi:MAG: VOC family protein [Candidatus Andeanibacterium colombiense]|uniref:VOC family protein n=1 Tax=Candidatus Andeanibacterium colombiense TaxID=3121345 RepID=A0AAJ5X6R5_9SPHN|nr:MAG: VOC family protein [Sphingomonadaceae bacterium]